MIQWIIILGWLLPWAGQNEPNIAGASDFDLRWNTIDGGGVTFSFGGDFELGGTIGQPDAGPVLSGGNFELQGGFWFQLVPGDCNSDSGINLFDFDEFQGCLTGPDAESKNPSCWCGNLDGDSDIDLQDVALLQSAFTNP